MLRVTYTKEELRALLLDTVQNDKKHKHYPRTVDYAKFCYQIMTGDDQRDLVVTYKAKESEEQKKQRMRVYNSRTKYVSGKVMSVFDKTKRADNLIEVIRYEGESAKSADKIAQLEKRLADFYEGGHLKKWLDDTYQRLNFYDPNAFLVCEFANYDMVKKDVWTFPLEFSSEQAINYEYHNGELAWLIVRTRIKLIEVDGKGKKQEKDGWEYRMYAPDWTLLLEQVPERPEGNYRTIAQKDGQPEQRVRLKMAGGKEAEFSYVEYETKSKYMPAVQVGYLRDPKTQNATFVSPLDRAEELLRDLIVTKSEYDIAKALHGFLQKFAYAEKCDFRMHEPPDQCDGGLMRHTKTQCPKCKGSGLLVHKSVQDVILVEMPDVAEGDKAMKLADMVYYASIPDNMIKLLRDDLDQLVREVMEAVFNANVFVRADLVKTATEVNWQTESTSNVLSDYGDKESDIYKLFVRITAVHLLIEDDLVVEHKFSSDWKLETVDQLLVRRKSALDAGAPQEILDRIDEALMAKQYADDQEAVIKAKVKSLWLPFRDKNEANLAMVLAVLPDDDPDKVLWTYFNKVFTALELAHKDFYHFNPTRQKDLIYEEVGKLAEEMRARKPARPAFPLDTPPADEDDEDEGGQQE